MRLVKPLLLPVHNSNQVVAQCNYIVHRLPEKAACFLYMSLLFRVET